MKTGLLLINLGTPTAPTIGSVRRYLREFLSDKQVIQLPWFLRYLLVYGVILPTRARRSAKAYQAIWMKEGAPLRYYSEKLVKQLQKKLEPHYKVALGMRYGYPSLNEALTSLKQCEKIIVLPLYPHYTSATTGSSIQYVLRLFSSPYPSLSIFRDFYALTPYINAQAAMIKPYLSQGEHVLFSYHGIPEAHLLREGCPSICTAPCSNTRIHSSCYRAQCFQTSVQLATACGLSTSEYSTAFQSRLGKIPWIRPYTDDMLFTLIEKNIKRLVVVCPSFVTDCLETLEEIGLRAKEQWLALGGEQFTLVPALNNSDVWIDAIIHIISDC